jgi:hypothetical protein
VLCVHDCGVFGRVRENLGTYASARYVWCVSLSMHFQLQTYSNEEIVCQILCNVVAKRVSGFASMHHPNNITG